VRYKILWLKVEKDHFILVFILHVNKGHFTFGAQPFWKETHLTWYLGQQLGSCVANGSIIGPLNIKPFDGPILCGLNGFSNGVDGFHLIAEVQ
jgi:hypothetical protein